MFWASTKTPTRCPLSLINISPRFSWELGVTCLGVLGTHTGNRRSLRLSGQIRVWDSCTWGIAWVLWGFFGERWWVAWGGWWYLFSIQCVLGSHQGHVLLPCHALPSIGKVYWISQERKRFGKPRFLFMFPIIRRELSMVKCSGLAIGERKIRSIFKCFPSYFQVIVEKQTEAFRPYSRDDKWISVSIVGRTA